MSNEFELVVFEPEVILPLQMTWGARDHGGTSGPHALMLAILEDATLCIERGRRRRHAKTRHLATEAEQWVHSDSRAWLFSFASICDVLGIDADALRVRLLTSVVPPADGGSVARAVADAPSTRSGAIVRRLSQRGSTPGLIAVETARTAARRTDRDPGTGSGFGVRTQLGVA